MKCDDERSEPIKKTSKNHEYAVGDHGGDHVLLPF